GITFTGRRSSISGLTLTSNQQLQNRHAVENFLRLCHFFCFCISFESSMCLLSPSLGAKSSISKNRRTSIFVSCPGCGYGARFAHSSASSGDFTWMIQYPAISSFDSVNGPSTTDFFPSAEYFTRNPFELPCKPAAPSRMPAFASCSLYAPIAAITSSLGILPASESLLAFTIIMYRIVFLLNECPATEEIQFPASLLRRTTTNKLDATNEEFQRNHVSPA